MLFSRQEFPIHSHLQTTIENKWLRHHRKKNFIKITINHHLRRLNHAVGNWWVLIVMIISDVSLQRLSMRAKWRQLLNVHWWLLMRRCYRNAQRHIIILILRRWKTIIIVEWSQFQSILKDIVRIFVFFSFASQLKWERKAIESKKQQICDNKTIYS